MSTAGQFQPAPDDTLPVALDEEGNELEATQALKRALLQLNDEARRLGIAERDDAASDAPAAAEGTYGLATLNPGGHIGSYGSLTAAALIVGGIDYQRYRKQVEYKHVLEIYAEFRTNEKKQGAEIAVAKLRERLQQSALEFEDLDTKYNTQTFRLSFFDKQRKSYGVSRDPGLPDTLEDYTKEQSVKNWLLFRGKNAANTAKSAFTKAAWKDYGDELQEKIRLTTVSLGHLCRMDWRDTQALKNAALLDAFATSRIVRDVLWSSVPKPLKTVEMLKDFRDNTRSMGKLFWRYNILTLRAFDAEDRISNALLENYNNNQQLDADPNSEEHKNLQRVSMARTESVRNTRFTTGLWLSAITYICFMGYSATQNYDYSKILFMLNLMGISLATRPLLDVGKEIEHSIEKADGLRAQQGDARNKAEKAIIAYNEAKEREEADRLAPPTPS